MNHEVYSAYPNEGEYLFMDGATFNVFDVEREVTIVNSHVSMSGFNNKKITIIHLLHAKWRVWNSIAKNEEFKWIMCIYDINVDF